MCHTTFNSTVQRVLSDGDDHINQEKEVYDSKLNLLGIYVFQKLLLKAYNYEEISQYAMDNKNIKDKWKGWSCN